VFGALLGPERTCAVRAASPSEGWGSDDVVVGALSSPACLASYRSGEQLMFVVGWWGCGGWVLGWLFENYTVDASIFVVK
jgi:hypothetical protein